jgi:hypothetical protein
LFNRSVVFAILVGFVVIQNVVVNLQSRSHDLVVLLFSLAKSFEEFVIKGNRLRRFDQSSGAIWIKQTRGPFG